MAQTTFDPTPLYAVVGATDLAVEQLRTVVTRSGEVQAQFEARLAKLQSDLEKAVGQGQKAVNEFDPKKASTQLQALPNAAAAKMLEIAGRYSIEAEETYGSFVQRGKSLVERIQSQQSTQDLIDQSKNTIARGMVAVTSARKAADAVLETASIGKRSAEDVVEVTTMTAKSTTRAGAKKSTTSAKKSAATTRARTAPAESAARGARAGAKKSATTSRKTATTPRKTAATAKRTAATAKRTAATAKKGPAESPEIVGV